MLQGRELSVTGNGSDKYVEDGRLEGEIRRPPKHCYDTGAALCERGLIAQKV